MVVLFAVVALALSACGSSPAAGGDAYSVEQKSVGDEKVYFIKQRPTRGELDIHMESLANGKLMVDERGCLRLKTAYGDGPGDLLLVWPEGFEMSTENGPILILNGEGRVKARVGAEIQVGGGPIPASSAGGSYEQLGRERGVPEECRRGPHWVIGGEVHLSAVAEAVIPLSKDTITSTFVQTPVMDGWETQKGEISGRLSSKEGCLRVRTGDSSYVPIWPPGYSAVSKGGEVRVLDRSGQIVARVGREVRLAGGGITQTGAPKKYGRLHAVTRACQGPYWVVSGEPVGPRNEADRLEQEARRYAEERGISLEEADALFEDAWLLKDALSVPFEEAVRQLELQDAPVLKGLERRLMKNERETFAGLWIQHKPEYRIVVLFTENDEETIQPYIEGKQGADLIEVRNGADATYAEILAAQKEAGRITDRLGMSVSSGTSVEKNRAELYVEDREHFEAALREADERLPNHIVVVEDKGLANPRPNSR